ncbi:MocR-like pyridoxine biosynthesis transcription factor PdxR [Aminipila terrae]|uniref:Aminotransferase class I/II-fold pyridoxal phosphate-dependent enzyme n=1 Tax=Aminipila terrae TaxID=2697030 RepID=A0A6P1MHH3_9FIRM|nr:PLP-dependent aminotransferase family protein [Aminipila terrae]QHI73191.1 aminotransferase class I/II-fold pyridoxal phosphate-dependent enzyme [Aminipila terrae]
MKAIIPEFDENSTRPLYLQLYDYIKKQILSNEMNPNEKLPSLRSLAERLNLSITTVNLAYSQLNVEGYIYSKPQSGYYVCNILHRGEKSAIDSKTELYDKSGMEYSLFPVDVEKTDESSVFQYDLSCFDFNKWKKCMNKVLTEYPHLLMFESDPQGELALRYEISKYIYRSRGVVCNPEQIVIGAGTQQITSHLCLILSKLGINHVAVEEPGYLPVKNMFRDRGFVITPVDVDKDGIKIHRLPANIKSAVYVSPSNQFPTGAVMPIAKRYQLLEWANHNNSIIIEDDYDSELRYFGKPIPALQGLDNDQRVVYLGSFSSTLFSSIKISYMVLPEKMADIFKEIGHGYTQTCSKTEQLTLALFMEQGLYQTNIKKLRHLYSRKLQKVIGAIHKYGNGIIKPTNTSSGINMIINVNSKKSAGKLCSEAKALGVSATPVSIYADDPTGHQLTMLVFYYNQIPINQIENTIQSLIKIWTTVK